jgi:hypothetical protein
MYIPGPEAAASARFHVFNTHSLLGTLAVRIPAINCMSEGDIAAKYVGGCHILRVTTEEICK